jgi:uncharacterized protein YoaH (UPF0181 family)
MKTNEEIMMDLRSTTDQNEQQKLLNQLDEEFVFKEFYGLDHKKEKETIEKEMKFLKFLTKAGMSFEEAIEVVEQQRKLSV